MNDTYSVYWIKKSEHSNVYDEGYVGISKNVKRRFTDHKNSKNRKSLVHNAINKYNDIECIVLFEGLSADQAKDVERQYRPNEGIGWNLAKGGGLPPNMKGIKRPNHSEKMKGQNNHFYGKTHSEETKLLLSDMKTGEKHPFYNTKRPLHSDKMKLLRGEKYPKFKGYFITPIGRFASYSEVKSKLSLSTSSVYNYCIVMNENKITKLSYKKSKYLTQNYDENIIGKTYKEIGFGFEYV
jgi:group I intron endonuclease